MGTFDEDSEEALLHSGEPGASYFAGDVSCAFLLVYLLNERGATQMEYNIILKEV